MKLKQLTNLIDEQAMGTPDDLLCKKSTTFIYTRYDRLYTIDGNKTHQTLEREISNYDEKFRKYMEQASGNIQVTDRDFMEEHVGLYGRLGPLPWEDHGDTFIISFWNENQDIYDTLLTGCLGALEKEGLIPDDMTVELHTPFDIIEYNKYKAETKRQQDTRQDNLERQERFKLQKRLHLLRGNEKKAALKKLGLWNPTKAEHPWQKAAPMAGQKWWAMQSDDIERLAGIITEDL
jgi:hypothetical protein